MKPIIVIAGMLFVIFCNITFCDTVEIGSKVYSDVIIYGISADDIFFLQAEKVKTQKSLKEITKLKLDMFPDFSRAEELASLSQYPQAMKQYLESYKKIKDLKTAWQATSDELFENGRKELSEIYSTNAKSDWIKDLIKIRYAKAKEAQSGGGQQNFQQASPQPDEKTKPSEEPNTASGDTCKECRGKGTVKCAKCNGSGKIKCTHAIERSNGTKEYHANHYEICPTCDGKGKKSETYTVWIEGRTRGTKYVPGYYSKRSRDVACKNSKCVPYPKDPRIHIIWMCPFCATGQYPGYIDCQDCQKGRCKCSACNGTKKELPPANPTTKPAV